MAKRKIDFTLRDYWNQDSLLVYKEAVSRYPYCAPARVSLLLNLKALDDPDYERELSFTALAVPDRQRLQEEVRVAEQAAAVVRERGERRMRQVAARWAAASATTAVVGRLMSAGGPAGADGSEAGEAATRAATVSAGMLGREVDFRAVAANEPGVWQERDATASADAVTAVETAGTAGETATSVLPDEEYPSARSRSSRRNARRLARREAQKVAERETAAMASGTASVAAAAVEAPAASLTISMLWTEEPATPAADAPQEPERRRPEVFNPWAEVFTAKHTISDWLQEEVAAENPAVPAATEAAVGPAVNGNAPRTDKSAKPAKTIAKSSKTAAKRKVKTAAAATVPPAPAAKPDVRPVPDYIDPNELIDRFLRKNDDHILIQVDEARDYSVFDPDRGSLREDWSMGSETLAQLYLKQGAPDKAIEIYRYLSLKFPEKNRYFASLIRAAEAVKSGK